MRESGHGKAAVEEFLAEAGGDGEGKVGKQLHCGLRQDAIGDGLERTARHDGDAADTAKVEPLETADDRRANEAGNDEFGWIVEDEAQLQRSVSACPDAPAYDGDGQPLEGDGRSVQHEPLHGADVRHGEQLLHARAPTPRQEHAESEEDQPEVPRHPGDKNIFGRRRASVRKTEMVYSRLIGKTR